MEITSQIQGQTLVLPNTLSFLKDALVKQGTSETIATIKLFRIISQQIESEEFIEEEQLYKASEAHQEELSYEIEVIKVCDWNIIVVPVFQDIINYEIISRELSKHELKIITITPGTLPFDSLVAEIGGSTTEFPQLVPPFVITGISASLVNQSKIHDFFKVQTLVLQSEGVSGYEKINHDSIAEVSRYIQGLFKIGSKFIKDVETLLNTGSSVNNFGLYL